MGIINESFMLKNETAKMLYNDFAKNLPIIDYHCHISPRMIAEDYKFKNAYDLFLGADHYKWRLMRSNGIDESMITGDGDEFEKWKGFATSLKRCIGNPLYHWTSLELKRYFDIDTPLSEKTALEIWDSCNELLKNDSYSARNLIRRSNVEALCTTDDPADDLKYHRQLKEEGFEIRVLPTFRPDKAVNIEKPDFIEYIKSNGITSYDGLKNWIEERIRYFHENGCRLSDHSLEGTVYGTGCAEAVFEKKMAGKELSKDEINAFKTAMLLLCAKSYSRLGWTVQLHMGALRNNNTKMFKKLGADAGFDSIADYCIAEDISKLLNSMEEQNILPKTILYVLNPKDNYVIGTMLANFQSGPKRGKIQFGSGWWFNDNRDGMEEQLKALANLGCLGNFVGMLTDSRSFVSYPRHEYFRRILCNLIGRWVEDGEYPCDIDALKEIIEGICYYNAKEYFEF